MSSPNNFPIHRPQTQLQKDLFDHYQLKGVPSKKVERWKFTSLKKWFEKSYIENPTQNPFEVSTKHKLEVISPEEALQSILSSQYYDKDDSLFNLFLSQLKNAYILTPLEKSLHIKYDFQKGCFSNTLIIIRTDHDLSIMEEKSGGASSFCQTTTIIEALKEVEIEHINFCHMDEDSFYQSWLKSDVRNFSHLKNFHFHLSAGLHRSNPQIILNYPKASCQTHSYYLVNNDEHFDLYSQTLHKKGETYSDQLIKGLLTDNAISSFTGNIYIDHNCNLVEANQFHKSLILSEKAQALGQPQLEIFSDDVKCSHGLATGKINPDEVFYFQSRGISERKAKKILSESYVFEVTQKIHEDHFKNQIIENFKDKLELFYE